MGFISKIGSFLGVGGLSGLMGGANSILKSVDGLTTSNEEKKELRAKVIDTMLEGQSAVIKAEAAAGGISAKWRPYTMLSFVAIILAHYVFFPMLAVIFPAAAPVFAAMVLPPQLWTLIQVGLGGYIGGRSLEKVTDALTTAKEFRKLAKIANKNQPGD